MTPSARAQIITRRTYNRPLGGGGFETWEQTVDRVIKHQKWLWTRALGMIPPTTDDDFFESSLMTPELEEFRQLMLDRKVLVTSSVCSTASSRR